MKLAPDDLHLLDTRGTILMRLPERLADARNDFTRLVEVSGDNTREKAKALLCLGRICAQLNDLSQAKEHLQRALQIDRAINTFSASERSEISQICPDLSI
jgi:Flp pilus assembly protein TadD